MAQQKMNLVRMVRQHLTKGDQTGVVVSFVEHLPHGCQVSAIALNPGAAGMMAAAQKVSGLFLELVDQADTTPERVIRMGRIRAAIRLLDCLDAVAISRRGTL